MNVPVAQITYALLLSERRKQQSSNNPAAPSILVKRPAIAIATAEELARQKKQAATGPNPGASSSGGAAPWPGLQPNRTILDKKKQLQGSAAASMMPGELDPKMLAEFKKPPVGSRPRASPWHGRLNAKLSLWKTFVTSMLILSWIESGLSSIGRTAEPQPRVFFQTTSPLQTMRRSSQRQLPSCAPLRPHQLQISPSHACCRWG